MSKMRQGSFTIPTIAIKVFGLSGLKKGNQPNFGLGELGVVVRDIELDANRWKSPLDFYAALLGALGAPDWHGTSVAALIDTMIWSEDINTVRPPIVSSSKMDCSAKKKSRPSFWPSKKP